MDNGTQYHVAVIGAGPAGIFAARELAKNGVEVFLLNRDIKPGGLAEYGIYPDKLKMKEGLRKQFNTCLDLPQVIYLGNVLVSSNGELNLDDLKNFGFDAILVASGAQGTKWVGLPGERLEGVYHAKDLVYHYNSLPPFSQMHFEIGKKVIIVGVGNVMMDIARYLIQDKKVDQVTAIARRGPNEVKFSRKEMEYVGRNFDLNYYKNELDKAAPVMKSVSQDPQISLKFIEEALDTCFETDSRTTFCIKFLSSILHIYGDQNNKVRAIELEENSLVEDHGYIRAKGTGRKTMMDCDTVIFAIGDGVDANFGLPVEKNEFVKNLHPRFPVDENSYEAFDPATNLPIEGVFLAGWARNASDGVVGLARKDGISAANAILQFLNLKSPNKEFDHDAVYRELNKKNPKMVDKYDLKILSDEEKKLANLSGKAEFKFSSNEEMLAAIEQKKLIQA